MLRLDLTPQERWLVNYTLSTSGPGRFTAFNSSYNSTSSFGNAGGMLFVGAGSKAGSGSYSRVHKFNNTKK